eukprot:scaffold9194_cov65-Phaeocystis_antarctica.AAC.2
MTPVPSAPRMPWLHLMAALSIAHAHRVPYARFTYARVSSPVVSTLWPGPNPNRACTFRAGDQIVDQLVDQIVGTPSPITAACATPACATPACATPACATPACATPACATPACAMPATPPSSRRMSHPHA